MPRVEVLGRQRLVAALALATTLLAVATAPADAAARSRWHPRAAAPVALGGAAGSTGHDGRIYLVGGQTPVGAGGDTCEVADLRAYTPRTNTWTTLAPMPTPRSLLAVATGPDGSIYALGGQSACFPQPDGSFGYSVVEAYSPRTDTWTTKAPMPNARYSFHSTTAPDGRIYVTGGSLVIPNGHGGFNTVPAADTWAFDRARNRWSVVAPMPVPLTDSSAALGSDGRIYEMGGVAATGSDPGATTMVEAYDPGRNRWSTASDMPEPRIYAGAALATDGRIYVVGGQGPNRQPPTSTLVFNPRSRKWSSTEPDPNPRLFAVVAPGRLSGVYEITGGGPNGLTNLNEVLLTRPRVTGS